MTEATIPAEQLRAFMAATRARLAKVEITEDFWFSGDGSTTAFVLPRGWSVKRVFCRKAHASWRW